MQDKILKFCITLFMAITGVALMRLASPALTFFISTEVLKMDMGFFKMTLATVLCILIGALLGIFVGRVTSPFFITKLKRFSSWIEIQLNKMPISEVIISAIGLALGLIIATLLGSAFSQLPMVGPYIPIVFCIVFGYLGIRIMMRKREDLAKLFDFMPGILRDLAKIRDAWANTVSTSLSPTPKIPEETKSQLPALIPEPILPKNYKLLDTSVIIDGRIADLCESGFIEGTLLIPVFVLEELQHIADSSDTLKRIRGRRGLDILQKIRTESTAYVQVEIDNRDFDDIAEVDSKLVRLAQIVQGKIITNDFNLNKVAQLRGIPVLNINALANAVKPIVIPGETMRVTVVKDGKEQGQGLAYLDDGTMIVIENGRRYLHSTINVEVTSALQTAAGRMIFAKPQK